MPYIDSLSDDLRGALDRLGITTDAGLASAGAHTLLTLPGMTRDEAHRLIEAARTGAEPEDETSRGALGPDGPSV